MDRVAFIDHTYHQKSKASAFLIRLLEEHRPVDLFWDDSWRGGPAVDLPALASKGYTRFLFFQVTRFRKKALEALDGKSVTVVPMYDDFPALRHRLWARVRDRAHLRFVCFSEKLRRRLEGLGFDVLGARYFPPLEKLPVGDGDPSELRGFFWQRTKGISWKHVRRLIDGSSFRSFTLHAAVDPGFAFLAPGARDVARYGIEQTNWFEEREDYYRRLAAATVFFAPRRSEGIGMSFLEAMAMGKCVVAHDAPTMNEYIVHGKTGLLYDARRPQPLDFSGHHALATRARRHAEEGRRRWLAQRPELSAFIDR